MLTLTQMLTPALARRSTLLLGPFGLSCVESSENKREAHCTCKDPRAPQKQMSFLCGNGVRDGIIADVYWSDDGGRALKVTCTKG